MKQLLFPWVFLLIANSFSNPYRDAFIEVDRLRVQESIDNHNEIKERLDEAVDGYIAPSSSDEPVHELALRRVEALLNDLGSDIPNYDLYHNRLNTLKSNPPGTPQEIHAEVHRLGWEIAMQNPLLDFDDIVLVEFSQRNGEKHMCDQYFGRNESKGGKLYILEDAFSENPVSKEVVGDSEVQHGFDIGAKIGGEGSFLSPDLSFDGKQIVFAWAPKGRTYDIYKINVDGTGLTKLTSGNDDDFDPVWLPNGRIAFISTLRGGYGRCHGRPVPTFTLHSMKADGSDLITLSYHETNEWHPSVTNEGKIVYTRWDYVDRDSDIAHHIWTCFPDGRDPRAPHGNYPYPWSKITDEFNKYKGDGRKIRPWMEMNIRSIPNSHLFVATAAPHHDQAFGSLVTINTRIEDDNILSQVKRLTPSYEFPESESGKHSNLIYATAWPLSESYYLCNREDYLIILDKFGNEFAFYKHQNKKLRPLDPIPLKARKKPPVLSTSTYQGENASPSAPKATIKVQNVYISDLPWPVGTEIKELRIMQLLPKLTIKANQPRIGYANQGIGRIALGTVPVEDDGSAFFEAPVGKPIFFQALDENGMAVQSMRSVTYVHPGEQMSCVGCHENKWETPPPLQGTPKAFQRSPSPISPEFGEMPVPIDFHRLVKPVLEENCQGCHQERGVAPDMSYASLEPYSFYFHGGGNGKIKANIHGGSRTIPGYFGAHYADKLMETTKPDHYGVNLNKEEVRRIVLWLDGNSNEFSTNLYQSEEKEGKLVWETLDVDPENPLGVEFDHPVSLSDYVINPANDNNKLKDWTGLSEKNIEGHWSNAKGQTFQNPGSRNSLWIRTGSGIVVPLRK